MVMMKEHQIKEMYEHGLCVTCKAEWSLFTDMERYCDRCKTQIIIIEDEVYFDRGW